jgi:hypothetical protein
VPHETPTASLLVLFPFTVHAEHLGNLAANEFDPNSVAKPFGAGSPYSSNSVTNEFGLCVCDPAKFFEC